MSIFLSLLVLNTLLSFSCSVSTQAESISAARLILSLSEKTLKIYNGSFPYVTLSYAQSLDGSIAPLNKTRWNLSSNLAFYLLHSLRARHDGVLIGIKTLFSDSPQLNVRYQLPDVEILHPMPRPIIIDSRLSILSLNPKAIKLTRPIICCTLEHNTPLFSLAKAKFAEIGGTIVACKPDINGR